jgi:GrpB-like predicted nucleotidyltransferase (UPF0157 family)
VEAFIRFLIQNNEKIVYISGGVICLLSAIVVWWQVFGKKGLNTSDEPQADLTGIEDMLRKILTQTNVAIQNVGSSAIEGTAAGSGAPQTLTGAAGAAPAAEVQAMTAGMESLKKELESRAHIIEELQAQVAAAKGSDNSGDLLAKIKNLEGKLAEYEIIEDDIADLSNFKEENARLQKELEALKRGGPQLVDQFADALNAKPMPTAAATTTGSTAAAAPAAEAQTADVLASVVAQAQEQANEFGVDLGSSEPSAPAEEVLDFAAPAAAAPQATAPTETAAPAPAKDDIFGEFSGDAPSEESDPLAALGDIDPDKMLDELKDLNADLSMGAEALEEAPDIDKMAQEAENLEKKG